MEKVEEIKKRCVRVIKNVPGLPNELKGYCVYDKKEKGQKLYLKAYIPFIGDRYGQAVKILFYCTAQNLAGNKDALEGYCINEDAAIYRLYDRKGNGPLFVDVGPVAGGVIPALTGVTLILNNKKIENLEECMEYIAFTNFYKFSLWTRGHKDLNPNNLDIAIKEKYDNFMLENYIRHEIEALKPDYVFCFRGSYGILKDFFEKNKINIKIVWVNDPAWILRGARGIDKWAEAIAGISKTDFDRQAERLIDSYCEYISKKAPYPKYQKKAGQIGVYLKHYYYEMRR